MQYFPLGASKIPVSNISFGAGPISGLFVGENKGLQQGAVRRAIQRGVNWFDTAASYGDGQSERTLGAALEASLTEDDSPPNVATKVRLLPEQLTDIPAAIRASVQSSLGRLQIPRIALIQLHNSVTKQRGDLPTSLSCRDVLGPNGVLSAFEQLRAEGLVEWFGFTGLGDWQSLLELVRSSAFTSVQVPVNLLTPFAGEDRSAGSLDVNYLELIDECSRSGVGVIAIRIFAGGALVGQAASAHTHKTKFFPLDLFHRDRQRAIVLAKSLPPEIDLAEASVRFICHLPGVSTALLGFAHPDQVDSAIDFAGKGPLPPEIWSQLQRAGEAFRDAAYHRSR